MKLRIFALVAFFPLLTATLATANERRSQYLLKLSLEEILQTPLVASTKTAVGLRDAPSVVSVLTQQDLQDMGLRTLEDVLGMIPGITTGRLEKLYSNQITLHVRGSYTAFAESVLVLVDGQRVNDPSTGGAFAFTRDYPIHHFKQIEVVRGPGSAVFGANAFLAVINLVTHQGDIENHLELAAGGGTLESSYASLNYGKRFSDRVKLSFSAHTERYELSPYDIASVTQTVPTPAGLLTRTFSDRFGFESSKMTNANANLVIDDWRLNLSYRRHSDRSIHGIGIPKDGRYVDTLGLVHTNLDSPEHHTTGDSDGFSLGLSRRVEHSARWSSSYAVTFFDYSVVQTFRGVPFLHLLDAVGEAIDEPHSQTLIDDTRTLNTDAFLEFTPSEHNSLLLGINYQRDQGKEVVVTAFGKSDPSLPFFDLVPNPAPRFESIDADRDIYALYVQHRWSPNDLVSLTTGIRGDEYSDFGSTVNPRLGLVLSPSGRFNLKLLAGSAFRAPTFYERDRTVPMLAIANSEIEPEKVRTYEVQGNWSPSPSLSLSLAGYTYEIEDVLREISTLNPLFPNETQVVNLGQRRAHGIEAELQWLAPRIVSGSVSYFSVLDSEDEINSSKAEVEGVPHNGLGLVLNFHLPQNMVFSLNGYSRWNFVDASPIPLVPGINFLDGIELPSYSIVNLSFTKRNLLGDSVDLIARVHNVLNDQRVSLGSRVAQPAGNSTDERQFLVGIRFRR